MKPSSIVGPLLALGMATCVPRDNDGAPATGSEEHGAAAGTLAAGFATATLPASPEGPAVAVAAWFPIARPQGVHVTVADLWQLARREEASWAASADAAADLLGAMSGDSAGDRAAVHNLLGTSMVAWHTDTPAPGTHPLVVWGVRHGTVLAQARLSEQLAGHGHVVIAAWPADTGRVNLWDNASVERKRATIDADTRALERAVGAAAERWNADTLRLTLLAWSYGGQSAARLSTRKAVQGIVSLDANVVAASAAERDAALGTPVLAIVGRDTSRRGWSRAEPLAQSVAGLRLPDLAHGNFNALEGYYPGVLNLRTVQRWSSAGPTAVSGYEALSNIVAQTVLSWERSADTRTLRERLRAFVPATGEWR